MWTALEVLTLAASAIAGMGAYASARIAKDALARSTKANETAQSALRFQVLWPALTEYRSPEMLVAIRTLWEFFRDHPTDLAEAFKSRWKLDQSKLRTLHGKDKLEYLCTTLDFHRRQVSHFYSFLTAVYDEQGALRKWIYTNWGKQDLDILPKIIIPMERALSESIRVPALRTTLERLQRLYDECPG
jgi:hypothetical protein